MQNLVLFDCAREETSDFMNGLSLATGLNWSSRIYRSNWRRNLLTNFFRYVMYFIVPLLYFIKRSQIANLIGWQAYYALNFAFYCRLFSVKKSFCVVVKNFIYNPKSGLLGLIYDYYIKFIVYSGYVDYFVCSSPSYCEYCKKIFGPKCSNFISIPFGVNDFSSMYNLDPNSIHHDYVLAIGRSNRDWLFLIDALGSTDLNLIIVCDELHNNIVHNNITVYNQCTGLESLSMIKFSKCVIIPILNGDIASGETVLLTAMSFGRPVVITKPSVLARDYVIDGFNGILVEKSSSELLSAINLLYEDNNLYETLSTNSREHYLNYYTLQKFGFNLGRSCIHAINI